MAQNVRFRTRFRFPLVFFSCKGALSKSACNIVSEGKEVCLHCGCGGCNAGCRGNVGSDVAVEWSTAFETRAASHQLRVADH